MAELDMDVEMAPQLGLDGQVDEDLIDYDTETEEQQNAQMSVDAQSTTREINGASDAGSATEHLEEQVELQMEGEDTVIHNAPPSHDPSQDDDDLLDMNTFLEAGEGETAPVPGATEQDADHEIDYDEIDNTNAADAEVEDGSKEEHEVAQEQSTSAAEPADEAAEPSEQNEQAKTHVPDDENEITWVENDDADGEGEGESGASPAMDNTATGQNDTEAQAVAQSPGEHQDVSNDQEQQSGHEHQFDAAQGDDVGDGIDFDHDAPATAEFGQESVAAGEDAEHSASQEDATTSGNSEFPDISVQYKGEGFPLFSLGSDGFFSEISALDDNMESLLAGLRNELENEIASEDELVFQIDEIGLEFSESCSRDILCATSLRQILEIFDLLVKNQDPDSTRTLYTCIYTKPSASKRFEYLVESATAGKGLDEVIHLFGPPNDGSPVEMSEAFGEQLGDHDSGSDENGEAEGGEEGEGEGEGEGEYTEEDIQQTNDQFDFIEVETEHAVEHAEDEDEEAVEVTHESTEAYDEEAPAESGIVDAVEQMSTLQSIQTLTNAETSGKITTARYIQQHDQELHACIFASSHVAYFCPEADESLVAQPESKSDPLLALDIDETADTVDIDFGDDAGMAAEAHEYDASTSGTLQNDDELIPNAVDAKAVADGDHEATGDFPAEQDELAEIDWRDETELAEAASETSPGTGKRPRTDDELGAEDEQDVKRRRP